MEEILLQQILVKLDSMDGRLGNLEGQMADFKVQLTDQGTQIAGIKVQLADQQEQIDDLRTTQAAFELRIWSEFAAIRDTHSIILDLAKESLNLLHEAKRELDESISARVAVDATLVDHQRRISYLEQKLAV